MLFTQPCQSFWNTCGTYTIKFSVCVTPTCLPGVPTASGGWWLGRRGLGKALGTYSASCGAIIMGQCARWSRCTRYLVSGTWCQVCQVRDSTWATNMSSLFNDWLGGIELGLFLVLDKSYRRTCHRERRCPAPGRKNLKVTKSLEKIILYQLKCEKNGIMEENSRSEDETPKKSCWSEHVWSTFIHRFKTELTRIIFF